METAFITAFSIPPAAETCAPTFQRLLTRGRKVSVPDVFFAHWVTWTSVDNMHIISATKASSHREFYVLALWYPFL